MMQRAPQRRRNGARPRTDFEDPAIRIVSHHHPARIARQTLGRFCGAVRAVFEDRLTGRLHVRQHRRVDVDHDLVALARGAGIDSVVERGLGDECECVRVLLLDRRRFRGTVLVSRFCWTVYVLRSRGPSTNCGPAGPSRVAFGRAR